jgi:serine acetyltransferase
MRACFVHPSAVCDSRQIGSGTRIWGWTHVCDGAVVGAECNIGEHCYIEGGARIGDRVTVKNGALIWEGVTIEDEVFLGPRTTFTNDPRPRVGHPLPHEALVPTIVRRGASLGASVTVVCGHTIGSYAFIGAGSLVNTDVPAHALVVGVPARWIGWVCRCGLQLRDGLTCSCGDRYRPAGVDGLALDTVEVPRVRGSGVLTPGR